MGRSTSQARRALSIIAVVSFASFAVLGDAWGVPGDTTKVSVPATGTDANLPSNRALISADGRFVAFHSNASNLLPVGQDTNAARDVFVRDRLLGRTTRVSVSSFGAQGNGQSRYPSISSDGRFVAFESLSSTFAAGDVANTWDTFLRDLNTNVTVLISVDMAGGPAGGSGDAFPDCCTGPSVSADGRYVAFTSTANDLVPLDTNNARDVFVRDTLLGTTTRVSVASEGSQTITDPCPSLGGTGGDSVGPSISPDGRWVAFHSTARNLWPGDVPCTWDVFLHDRVTPETTILISASFDGSNSGFGKGTSDQGKIAGQGRFVLFQSLAANLVAGDTNGQYDAFVRDRDTDEDGLLDEPGTVVTRRVSTTYQPGVEPDGASFAWSISADGRYVATFSNAANIVPRDFNVKFDAFVYDLVNPGIVRISVDTAGREGKGSGMAPGDSTFPVISADGRFVAFESSAVNLGCPTPLPVPLADPLRTTFCIVQGDPGLLPPPADTNNGSDVFANEVCWERGFVSQTVHSVENLVVGPAAPLAIPPIHYVNCHYVVPLSL